MSGWDWGLDGWIVAAGVLCAAACALLGNFLVLRRMSMLGDAITHAILPGLAAAFLITGSRSSIPMFVGAVVVGVLTAVLTEWIRRLGRVDEGASMGVVFTTLFAAGLLMIVRAADRVDLDAGCVLYGAIELTPLDAARVGGVDVPRAVLTLAAVVAVNAAFVGLFFKELKVSSFDPALATATGFSAAAMHYGLMVLVAVTAVASFESVGNILVVAMFVVPPAAAYLLTDRLGVMVLLSVAIAAASAAAGHAAAVAVPGWFGYRSTTTAGMMAVASGLALAACVLAAPRHGVLTRLARRRRLSRRILADDVLAALYRAGERDAEPMTAADVAGAVLAGGRATAKASRRLREKGLVAEAGGRLSLTEAGRAAAGRLVRSHRLWERYLSEQADLAPGRLHGPAERLEHFTGPGLREELDAATGRPATDPHGTPIPQEP